MVFASGDARGCFFKLIGRDRLPTEYAAKIDNIPLMESIHMVHLGWRWIRPRSRMCR